MGLCHFGSREKRSQAYRSHVPVARQNISIYHVSLLLCRISALITCPCCYATYQHLSHVPVAMQNISIDHMSLLLGRKSAGSKAKEFRRKHCFHLWTVCLLQTMWRDGVSNGNQSLVSTVSVSVTSSLGEIVFGAQGLAQHVWGWCLEPLYVVTEVAPILR
jgi:hypothetical protein